jgi:putative transposase
MAGPKKLKTQIRPLTKAIGLSVFRLSIGPFVLCDFLYESLHHPIQSYIQLEVLEAEPDKIQRKVIFRMYPKAAEVAAMNKTIVAHCKIYNTLLETSRLRYKAGLPAFDRASAYLAVKAIRLTHQWIEEATTAQSVQATADRLIRAFDNFFRRVAKGQTPGYPRFKSSRTYQGWGYKTYGDGWDLSEQKSKTNATGHTKNSYGAVRLSGIGNISIHGAARFIGIPKTAEVVRKNGKWFLSVTFNVSQEAIARTSGSQSMAFDWGLTTLLTMVVGDSFTGKVKEVKNPRWLKKQLSTIARLQQFIAKTETAAKAASGKQKNFPVCHQLRNAYARRRSIHQRIANQRHDFYHQITAALVKTYGLIITEELAVKNMTKSPKPKEDSDNPGQYLPNGASAKGGLNRSILDAAPATLLALLDYKATEAGSKLQFIPTRVVKPTQRCHLCGVTTNLTLKDRTWECSCGSHHNRDINAARTMMRYAYERKWWKKNSRKGIGQELAGFHEVARNSIQIAGAQPAWVE